MPVMKILIRDVLADRSNWNVTAQHEIFETIVDPYVDQTVKVTDAAGITWEYAKEVADSPEDDRWAKRVNGHLSSNAVTPAFFDPLGKPPYTIYPCPEVTKPFEIASGGYLSRREVAPSAGEWQQEFSRMSGSRQVKADTSRTIRRFARDLAPAAP
jgi:hypothetical protein